MNHVHPTDDADAYFQPIIRNLGNAVANLTAERNRARATAVALEQQLARVGAALRVTADDVETGVSCGGYTVDDSGCFVRDLAARIRAAIAPEATR